MGLLTYVKESAASALTRFGSDVYKERVSRLEDDNWLLQESLNRLELEIENEGYYRLTQLSEYHFDRKRLTDILRLAVQMAIKNPITNRTVNVQADYVFGRGVRFVAKNEVVQEWIDEFCSYRENRKVLTSGTAMRQQERNLQIEGNLFFVMFSKPNTGRVIIRCVPTLEIQDVIRDPDDYHRELFIRRTYDDGAVTRTVYHPVLWITENSGVGLPWEYGHTGDNPKGDIQWDAPIYHVRFNVFGKEKFAVPEIYPQLDWALAYKRFLEDWTSIIRSFARMALKVTGLAGKKQAAATKNRLQTTTSITNPIEKNPSAVGGAISLLGKGIDIEAVKTAGATTPAKEGAPVLNMAAAAAGLPNHFFGDSSQGNFATAKTLDRPTELKMLARQELWKEVFQAVFEFVVYKRGLQEYDGSDREDLFTGESAMAPNWPADFELGIEVIFPDILERNVTDRVRALVNAVTLFGKQITDIIPDKKLVARLLMEALDITDIDARLDDFVAMWTKNMGAEPGKPIDPLIIPPAPVIGGAAGAEDPSQGGDVGSNG